MRLKIIRHGHSPYKEGLDSGLSRCGQRQAAALAQRLVGEPPAMIYTSPRLSCLETSSIVAAAAGVRPLVWTELAENGLLFGRAGIARSNLIRSFPLIDVPESFPEDGWAKGRFEGRRKADDVAAKKRAGRVIAELCNRELPAGDVCLVTHAAFANMLLEVLLKLDNDESWFTMGNGSVTCLDLLSRGKHRVMIRYVNDRTHLLTGRK